MVIENYKGKLPHLCVGVGSIFSVYFVFVLTTLL